MHTLERGTGPTLLFVHGAPMGAITWSGVFDRLAGRFHCVAPNLPGYGDTPPLETPMGVAEATEALVAWFDEQGLDDVVLVMNDTGGAVGTGLAARRPARIAGLVSVDALGFSLREFLYIRFMLRLLTLPPVLALLTRIDLFGARIVKATLPPLGPAEAADLLGVHHTRAGRRRVLELLGSLVRQRAFLRTLDAAHSALAHLPVLTVFGSHDPARLAGFPQRWARSFPDHSAVVVPGGHFSQHNSPAEVASAIASWHADRVAVMARAS